MPEDMNPPTEQTPGLPATDPRETATVTLAVPVPRSLLTKLAKNEDDILKAALEAGPEDDESDLLVYDITKGDTWRAPGTLVAWSPNNDRTEEVEQAFMNAAIKFAKDYVAHHEDPAKNPAPVVQEGWIWVDENVVLEWIKGMIHDNGVNTFTGAFLEDMEKGIPFDLNEDPFMIGLELQYEAFVHHVLKKE